MISRGKDSAIATETDESWRQPAAGEAGLRRFLRILRERVWLIAGVTAAALVVALAYLATADKVYEAETDVLVTPLPNDDQLFASLGLIAESADPTLDVQTAAQLILTVDVAERTIADLKLDTDANALLDDITVKPVGQSNVVAITASQPSPDQAAELANGFAKAALAQRDAELRKRIDQILPGLSEQLAGLPADALASQSLAEEVVQLQSFRATGDPTIRIENAANPPESASSPRPALTIAIALFGGLAVGIGAAYALEILDPRLRREEQLRALYRLPILARIPRERHSKAQPLGWDDLSAGGFEAYRVLRATITAAGSGAKPVRSILVTGSAPAEGKSTTAISLASALARSGASVILIEADLRRPAIAGALGLRTKLGLGVVSVLTRQSEFEEALLTVDDDNPRLRALLADQWGPGVEELFSVAGTSERLIGEAEERADYVVVDSPPLTEVVDALPLASHVDAVLMVARLGVSRLNRIRDLGELLAGYGVRPAGFAVVGTTPRAEGGYYYDLEQRAQTMSVRNAKREREAPPVASRRT